MSISSVPGGKPLALRSEESVRAMIGPDGRTVCICRRTDYHDCAPAADRQAPNAHAAAISICDLYFRHLDAGLAVGVEIPRRRREPRGARQRPQTSRLPIDISTSLDQTSFEMPDVEMEMEPTAARELARPASHIQRPAIFQSCPRLPPVARPRRRRPPCSPPPRARP